MVGNLHAARLFPQKSWLASLNSSPLIRTHGGLMDVRATIRYRNGKGGRRWRVHGYRRSTRLRLQAANQHAQTKDGKQHDARQYSPLHVYY